MSDEPQAPQEGTPNPVGTAPEAPDVAQQESPSDYQKRYDDMRPEFDRRGSRLTELEQREQWFELLATSEDPDTRRQAAQNLGYEVADEEEDPAEATPYLTREEWQAYQDQQKQTQEQAAQEQLTAFLETTARSNMQAAKVPEHLHEWVLSHALAQNYATPEGHVDVGRAYKEFVDQVRAAEQAEWKKSKAAHPFSPVGAEGTQQPDLSTHEGRVAHVLGRQAAEEM